MAENVKVLVTGPTGAVGREVVKQLVEQTRYTITVFEKRSPQAEKILAAHGGRLRVVWGDITDPASLAPACTGQDAVLHVAALIPPLADEKPALAEAVNVGGTANLIAALTATSPHAFLIYTSSISVYGDRNDDPWIRVGDPLEPSVGDEYARTKIKAERLIEQSTLDWSILRLTAIMGVDNHKMTGLMFHMPLDTPLEIATPTDTARALVNAIDQRAALSGRIINLAGGAACRILYRDFLARSFALFGLGALDFPPKAFAEKNFHCGYYADGDALEDLLHFRRDTIESYFRDLKAAIPSLQRFGTRLVSPILKKALLAKSEPYQAWQTGDADLIARFFK